MSEANKNRGIDLVRGALQAFPKADWAVITLPRQIHYFSLLDLFTRVTPKGVNVQHEVFVLHRCVLSNKALIRPSTKDDIRDLTKIDFDLGGETENAIDEGCDDEGVETHAMTIMLSGTIIGGIVLKIENQIRKLRSVF